MSGFTNPISAPVALAGLAVSAPAGTGVPSLAAFIDLMVGAPSSLPSTVKLVPGERQDDAVPGKPLPDDAGPTDADPALAWLMAAPPAIVPPAALPAKPDGDALAAVVSGTSTAIAMLPVALVTPTVDDTAVTPLTQPTAAGPIAPPLDVVLPAPVLSATAPVATLPISPQVDRPAAAPIEVRFSPVAAPLALATPSSPAPARTDPAPAITMRDLVGARLPDAVVAAAIPVAAPLPLTTAAVVSASPVIPVPAQPQTDRPVETSHAEAQLPVRPAPTPPPAQPATASRWSASVAPALFALARQGNAAARADDRDAIAPLAPFGAQALTATDSLAAVAQPGAAQQQTLDLGRQDWPHRMIEHIETLRDNADATDTSIRLKPDALGRVDVSLRTHDDGAVSVRFTTDQPATRALIADATPQLREAAEARGLRLSGTSVDLSGQGGDQRARPEIERRQPIANHLVAARGDDIEAVEDGRIA